MQKVSPEALTYSLGKKGFFAPFPKVLQPRAAEATCGRFRGERRYPDALRLHAFQMLSLIFHTGGSEIGGHNPLVKLWSAMV